ncbi:MAG: hypothetical protein JXB62_08270 [Pirellulales bacterium]|nr:hypothetical protein [Pirellulales bacterium]
MQISQVSTGYSDPAALGKRSETQPAAGNRQPQGVEAASFSGVESSAAAAEILARYDVTDISPSELTEMIQKLYESGAISEGELQQLTAIRHDLEREGIDSDESVNLLEFYTELIEKQHRRLEASGETDETAGDQLRPLLRRLDWVEKFALVQSAPDAVGLDEMA